QQAGRLFSSSQVTSVKLVSARSPSQGVPVGRKGASEGLLIGQSNPLRFVAPPKDQPVLAGGREVGAVRAHDDIPDFAQNSGPVVGQWANGRGVGYVPRANPAGPIGREENPSVGRHVGPGPVGKAGQLTEQAAGSRVRDPHAAVVTGRDE